MPAVEHFYSSQQVSRLTGLSARQIAYWRRTGLLTPHHLTQGGHARYSFRELVALRAARQLMDAQVSVQRLRSCLHSLLCYLPTVQQPLSELTLLATGDVVLVLRNDQIFDAISGQEWLLPLAELLQTAEMLEVPAPEQGELFPGSTHRQQGGATR